MHRKRFFLIALPTFAALVAAGVAVAASTHATATQVSATFSATSVSKAHNTTCTAKSGDAFRSTTATYKGTSSSSDARLNGTLTIRAHSFIDTTSGLGTIQGVYLIKGSGKSKVAGVLDAVVSNGALSGIAGGETKGPAGHLLASLGGTFDPASGFTTGSLGAPNTGAGAVIANGACPRAKKK